MSPIFSRLRAAAAALLHDVKGPSPDIILTTPEEENFGRTFGIDTARIVARSIKVDARGTFDMDVVTPDNFFKSSIVLEDEALLGKMEWLFGPATALADRDSGSLAFDKITALRVTSADGSCDYYAVMESPDTILGDKERRLRRINEHESMRPVPRTKPAQTAAAKL